MTEIDYDKLAHEFISILDDQKSIVLATEKDHKVTARTMSHVNDGMEIYFQTGSTSEKYGQIMTNSQIAFAVGNMQIEAVAEVCGHPSDNPGFISLYKKKFPQYYELYTNSEDEVVIKASPVKVTLFKYIDGKSCRDILGVSQRKAYRV